MLRSPTMARSAHADVTTIDPAGPVSEAPEPASAAAAVNASELFELVYRQMRKLARGRDLDELVQVAVEQALRSLPSFEGRSRLSTWTFRICYLTLRKHDRWYRRWLRRFTLTSDGELPERADDDADAAFARSERLARLRAALARITEKQRSVVLLHDLEGLAIDEVAEVVGAAPAAVRSRLRDGRRALAALLRDDPYFGDEACRGKERS